jgi:hypothetical protein
MSEGNNCVSSPEYPTSNCGNCASTGLWPDSEVEEEEEEEEEEEVEMKTHECACGVRCVRTTYHEQGVM